MRRIVRQLTRTLPAFFVGLILLLPCRLFAGPQDGLIIRLKDAGQAQAIANRNGLQVKKSIIGPSGQGLLVVEGTDSNGLRNKLSKEPAVDSVEDNVLIPLDDNGETVLPLDDNGETVLPLGVIVMPLDDNGETVLPLDDNGETVLPLDDNGETVLPLDEINKIKTFYNQVATTLTPSQHLLIQSSFVKMGLYDAALRATGKGVIVADLDTGADSCHPVLRGVLQLSFVSEGAAPEDCATAATPHGPGFGHGTAVGSLIRVVAPGATLWSLRVFGSTGTAQLADVYAAIVYATDHGANVINMSFGTDQASTVLKSAIDYAYGRGVILVAAGGNSGRQKLMYPAAYPQVDGIVAVDAKDIKPAFSNFGGGASLSAPGVSMWAAYPNRMLSRASGTSYASPLVAAEAALVLEAWGRTHAGTPTRAAIDTPMLSGVANINWLNLKYAGKIGNGRIYLPFAISLAGLTN